MASGANTCRMVCLYLADHEPYRSGWLRDRAITSATKPLQTALRPDEVADAAQAAADAAFAARPACSRNMSPTEAPGCRKEGRHVPSVHSGDSQLNDCVCSCPVFLDSSRMEDLVDRQEAPRCTPAKATIQPPLWAA
jgi:hypothetical protein